MTLPQARAALLGLSVADALGVPVEFQSREALARSPVTGVRGHGTYDQPPGTFSDDSTMAFCLAETIVKAGGRLPLDYYDLANRFFRWVDNGYWTPHGKCFDIGHVTGVAIHRMRDWKQVHPAMAGGAGEYDNGNGSLMRILPLLRLTPKLDPPAKLRLVREASGMTHAHPRSVLCCLYYVLLAERLLAGAVLAKAYPATNAELADVYLPLDDRLAAEAAHPHLARLLDGQLATHPEATIYGDGYVVNALKASIWCLFQTDDYRSAVLRAINLGEDTDTTAAIAGGLAALMYGVDSIPEEWLSALVRREDVEDLAARLAE